MTTQSIPPHLTTRQASALELVRTGETRPYTTTETSCTCNDFVYRRVACKHIFAMRVQTTLDAPVWAVALPWSVGPLTCTFQGVACKIVAAQMTESGDSNVTIETLDGLATLHGFSDVRHHAGPYATSTLTVARSILEAADPAGWEKIAETARLAKLAPQPTQAGLDDTGVPKAERSTRPADVDPFRVDGFEITRLDFFVQADGTTIVKKLGQAPVSNGNHVVLAEERKVVDLDKALAFCRKNGYATRRWSEVRTATFCKPAGARAWKGDEPWPVRTEGQIRKLRAQLNGQAAGLGHALNLAFDL